MPTQSPQTHVLLERQLVIYRRARSGIWQCRYKVAGVWQRTTTKETNLKLAKEAAKKLLIAAEIRKANNLPVVSRKFRDIAKLAIQRMQTELAGKGGKDIYNDYIRVTQDYLIPALGKRSITNIDYSALDELDAKRIQIMCKAPSKSTLQTHNAALNRVLDEAVIRGFLTEANRIKIDSKGKASDRRPAFELHEIQALLKNLDEWIESARTDDSKERRELVKDYIELLLDTGARPGKELLQLKWKQIKTNVKPALKQTETVDEEGEKITLAKLNRSCEMTVTGKTGTRTIVGMQRSVKVLARIALRNYGLKDNVANPIAKLTTPSNNDYVLRTKANKVDISGSVQKMFESFLREYNLLLDPKTEQHRVFYSLRHTYATLALTHDNVPIHTLAKQMGTSVAMIEKHYSHLKVVQAIEQLRGEKTNRLINSGNSVSSEYKSNRKSKQ